MADKLKRRHHTVPKFHLARFANDRSQLTRVALPGDKRHLISIRDATVERDFYLIEEEDGTRSDALEDLLADSEGRAAAAVRALVDEGVWPIPDQVRWDLAGWAASQALRTTANRQSSNEVADMMFKLAIGVGGKKKTARGLREALGREPSPAEIDREWERLSDFDGYTVKPHPNGHLSLLMTLWPGTAHMFHDRGWSVVRFEHKALVTSDNPVHLVPAPDHPEWSGVGLATAAQIFLPLDRRVGLIMGEVGGKDMQAAPSADLARRMNAALAMSATAAVFHHPDDNPLVGLELPAPHQRRTGGYEQVKSFVSSEWPATSPQPR